MFSSIPRGFRALVAASVLVLGVSLVGPGTAFAVSPRDPVHPAGCADHRINPQWGNHTYPPYQYELNFHWCWTTGGSTSRIYDVRGSAYSQATTIFQTQNAIGPVGANRIPVNSASWFGNELHIFGFFQSRDCATGAAGWFCTAWHWHQSSIVILGGGSWQWYDQS